jgi:hypothetical protein
MATSSPTDSTHRRPTTWRGVALAIGLGLVLGTIVSVAIVWFRPIPTGIATVEVIELGKDSGPGRSWVLELEVDRSGYPFLVHLDEDGMPSLLYPDGEITRLDAGERRRLPDATGHRAWRRLGGVGGGEVFVTLSGTPYLALDRVIARAERAAAQASSEDAARRVVREVLRKQLGPGVIVQLPHTP